MHARAGAKSVGGRTAHRHCQGLCLRDLLRLGRGQGAGCCGGALAACLGAASSRNTFHVRSNVMTAFCLTTRRSGNEAAGRPRPACLPSRLLTQSSSICTWVRNIREGGPLRLHVRFVTMFFFKYVFDSKSKTCRSPPPEPPASTGTQICTTSMTAFEAFMAREAASLSSSVTWSRHQPKYQISTRPTPPLPKSKCARI